MSAIFEGSAARLDVYQQLDVEPVRAEGGRAEGAAGMNIREGGDPVKHFLELGDLAAGVLVGTSRKSFLGKILDLPVDERLEASLASYVGAVLAGAHVVRVHDVQAAVRAVKIADALRLGAAP